MAVGDLEGKIGEVAGQLRMLVPTLEALGNKVGSLGERVAALQENLKGAWEEIGELKKKADSGANRWWQAALMLVSAVIGGIVAYFVARLTGKA